VNKNKQTMKSRINIKEHLDLLGETRILQGVTGRDRLEALSYFGSGPATQPSGRVTGRFCRIQDFVGWSQV
jgi:hypothetical protein